jgi:phosphonate transport system substrate-binding protein
VQIRTLWSQVLLLLLVASCSYTPAVQSSADPRAGWPSIFTIGYFAGDDSAQVTAKNQPIQDYFQMKLGMPVRTFTATSYSAVVEAMRAGRIDALEVGPFAYVLAVQEAGAEALGANVSAAAEKPQFDPELNPYYYSWLVTLKGSGIATTNDLRGRTLAFVDPASTSGHLIPKAYLLKNGVNPDTDMRTTFSGSHATALLAVWNKKADAATISDEALRNLTVQKQVDTCWFADGAWGKRRSGAELKNLFDACPVGRIIPIAQSDPIPDVPFAVNSKLPASFKTEVKKALLAMKDDSELISKTKHWYVDPSAALGLSSVDEFYKPLRDAARLLGLDLRQLAH